MDQNLKNAINISGNNLHMDVVDCLEKMGWIVNVSSYYYDDVGDKPREIDVIAQKDFEINQYSKSFRVLLFIECKFFRGQAIRFITLNTTPKERKDAMILNGFHDVFRKTEGSILCDNGWDSRGGDHHYITRGNVGKLYDITGESKRNNQGRDNVFLAFTQSIKSLIFFKAQERGPAMFYPVVIYDGIDGIYKTEKNGDIEKSNLEKKLIFGLKYSWKSFSTSHSFVTQQFFVDFVHKSELESFLGEIEKEAGTTKDWLCLSLKK